MKIVILVPLCALLHSLPLLQAALGNVYFDVLSLCAGNFRCHIKRQKKLLLMTFYFSMLVKTTIAATVLLSPNTTVSVDDRINEIENDYCSNQNPDQDDLPGFDLISRFRLDDLSYEFPGVKRVRGSNRIQTAYRLSRRADLTAPTR